jgi:hypothetical protein
MSRLRPVVIRSGRRRTVRRNVTATKATAAAGAAAGMAATAATALGKGGLRNEQENDERAKSCPHISSAGQDGKGSAAQSAI